MHFSAEPDGYGQIAAGAAIDPDGRIVVAATIIGAPPGATLDLDPGPGVASFVTPSDLDFEQLAVIVLAP